MAEHSFLFGAETIVAAQRHSSKSSVQKYDTARYELLPIGEWLTEDVDDVAVRFLFELVERRHMSHSTVLCTQYTPAKWHGRLVASRK